MPPKDRWVGASPGGNVTPGGKALELVDRIKEYLESGECDIDDITAIVDEYDFSG